MARFFMATIRQVHSKAAKDCLEASLPCPTIHISFHRRSKGCRMGEAGNLDVVGYIPDELCTESCWLVRRTRENEGWRESNLVVQLSFPMSLVGLNQTMFPFPRHQKSILLLVHNWNPSPPKESTGKRKVAEIGDPRALRVGSPLPPQKSRPLLN